MLPYAQFADQTVQIGTITTYGTAGNDSLNGTSGNDIINFSQGGDDIVSGLDGDDTLIAGAALTAADTVDGGDGFDTLTLSGNYSGSKALTLGATTLQNVEAITLGAGFNYSITTDDGTVAAGQNLSVDASAISGNKTLTFNGAAEQDGNFDVIAGAGLVTLTGGAGNDSFTMGANLTTADKITGGAGFDTVSLNGDYSSGLTLGATTITGVEDIALTAGHSYNITSNNATVAAGASLTVDGGGLGAGDSMTFNGAAETNGAFTIAGGAGADTLTGGAGNDTFDLGDNLTATDQIAGGGGNDTLMLDGDYSAGVALSATTLTGIGNINLLGGSATI